MARSIFADDENLVTDPPKGADYDSQGNPIVPDPQKPAPSQQSQPAPQAAGSDFDAQGNPIGEQPQAPVQPVQAQPAAAQQSPAPVPPVTPQPAAQPAVQQQQANIDFNNRPNLVNESALRAGQSQSAGARYSESNSELRLVNPYTGEVFKEGDYIPPLDGSSGDGTNGTRPDPKEQMVKQVIEDIYKTPDPYYDKNRPEELRRIAKMNALGKGFSVLSEALSLGLGGRVRRRPDDKTIQQLWKDRNDYEDDYKKRREMKEVRDRMNKLNALAQMPKEEQKKYQVVTLRNSQSEGYNESAGQSWPPNYGGGGGGGAKQNQMFDFYDDENNKHATVEIPQGQLANAYRTMIRDEAGMPQDIFLLARQFGEKAGTEQQKEALARFWYESPALLKFLGVDPANVKISSEKRRQRIEQANAAFKASQAQANSKPSGPTTPTTPTGSSGTQSNGANYSTGGYY